MIDRALSRALFSLACLATNTQGDSYKPYEDQRVVDPTGCYYVVLQRAGGPQHANPVGPVRFTIVTRRPGTSPVTPAHARVVDSEDPVSGDWIYMTQDHPDVSIRKGDLVCGRGKFQDPPSLVLVSSRGLGFAALGICGGNLYGGIPYGDAITLVSLRGEVLFKVKLSDLFTPSEINQFEKSVNQVAWLRGGWIDEGNQTVVVVASHHLLREVGFESKRVQAAGAAQVLHALSFTNSEALKLALELEAEMRLRAGLEPTRRIFARDSAEPAVRLRAAIALAILGDPRGVDFVTRTVRQGVPWRHQEWPLKPEEWNGKHQEWDESLSYAVQYLPEALGIRALPLLRSELHDQGYFMEAIESFVKLGSTSVPTLIEALRDKDRNVRQHAAEALGELGSRAETAVPALRAAQKDDDESVRSAIGEAIQRIKE